MNLMLGDCLERMKEIPDGSVDMVLTDPPYTGMINEYWDKKPENENIEWFSKCIAESSRVLRYGGRLILFGSHKTQQFIYPFISENNLVHRELLFVDKGKQVLSGRNISQYKMHPNTCELINVNTKYARPYTSELIKNKCLESNVGKKEFHDLIGSSNGGGGMWSIYTGNNIGGQVPTKDIWECLQNKLSLVDYSKVEEVYNGTFGSRNILSNFNFRIKNRVHPTQKPVEIMEYLIKTYTNENETVLDFTAGSFTTGVACVNLDREFIGIEMDENYFKIGEKRIQEAKDKRESQLF